MKSRMVKSAVSIAVLIGTSIPLASHAGDNPALERCVQMFVDEVVPADHNLEIRREQIVSSIHPIDATRSRVTLIAKGEKYSRLFGLASCEIDSNGTLVSMYRLERRPGEIGYSKTKLLARNIDATQGSRTASVDSTKPF